MKQGEKNIILYVGKVNVKVFEAVAWLSELDNKQYRLGLITSREEAVDADTKARLDVYIETNTQSEKAIEDALLEIHDEVVAVNCFAEYYMPAYARIVPLFSYLRLPTGRSIRVCNNKIKMRQALKKYVPKATPRFMIVTDATEKTLFEIEKNVKFPCVVKPAALTKSQLVATCYYREELEATLKDTSRKIKALYKQNKNEQTPEVLVEQLIEGQLYSVDVYINSRGKTYWTQFIELTTGKDIGHDDFFMYAQMTPSRLTDEEKATARNVIEDSIHALGIRSSTAHVEFYRTKSGFKIVEIGARIGGYRQELLSYAYGYSHYLNDILIKLGRAPIIKSKTLQHVVFLKFWPTRKGVLKSLKRFKKLSEEEWVLKSTQHKKVGDKVGLSKFGHKHICEFFVSGETRSKLLGHKRKIEKNLLIELE